MDLQALYVKNVKITTPAAKTTKNLAFKRELKHPHLFIIAHFSTFVNSGGSYWAWTSDLTNVNRTL